MLEDPPPVPDFIPPDLTHLPAISLSHSLPVFPADSVMDTGTSGELLQPVPQPPPPKPLPIETWKPRLEQRVAEMAAKIGAPKWFRWRFDLSDEPAGYDHKIGLWSD